VRKTSDKTAESGSLEVTLPAHSQAQWVAGVQCLVSTGELRRLLCLMAATELLQELSKSLRSVTSAREMKLPPALF
jgi:hypothetical protein